MAFRTYTADVHQSAQARLPEAVVSLAQQYDDALTALRAVADNPAADTAVALEAVRRYREVNKEIRKAMFSRAGLFLMAGASSVEVAEALGMGRGTMQARMRDGALRGLVTTPARRKRGA